MDFHSLTRRELQALCKQNGIPANITNVGMADALTALHSSVQKIEEISESLSVRSSVESPEKVEVTSPRVPRTRTTRKKVESSTVVNKATTTTRRVTRNKKDGVAPVNIDVQFSEVDNHSEIRKGKEACITQTPSMVSDTRKRSSKAEITTTKAYSTRRSTRLASKTLGHTETSVENKENADAANMKLFSADCGDNFEMNDNECTHLSEDVQSIVSHLKEDASETIKCEEILSNYSAVDIPIDLARESPKDSNKSAEKVKIDEQNGILGNIGEDINEEASIENKDEIIGENGNDTNEQAVVEMKDEVAENNGEFDEEGDKLNDNGEIMIGGVEVCGDDINPNDDNDDGILVSKMMDMSLTSINGVITQIEDHAVSEEIVVEESLPMSEEEEPVDKIDCEVEDFVPMFEDELLPKSEVGDLVIGDPLLEAENHALNDAIVADKEEHVIVKVAAVEQVDQIDCDEPIQQYSKEDKLLPKSEVEDLVNGSLVAETENQAASDAIVNDEFVPMSEVEDHVPVKAAVGEHSDKIDCDVPSQEFSKEDELLPKSGVEDLVNDAAGQQLGNGEDEFLFDSMPSDEEKVDDLVNGKSGKPSQKSSNDEKFSLKSFSVEESSEEEGSESVDESEEGSEDESEEEEESEEEDIVFDAVGGQLVNRDSDKPIELISKEDLPRSFSMEECKEEERPKAELEEVEDLAKVAAGAQLDKKPSENSEDASTKASIFVDASEGNLPLSAMSAPPAPGKNNPDAAVIGKENLEKFSMRQIRKMIKNLNINGDSKNDKEDNLVKKSDEELVVETASRRPALQILPENQN